MTEHACEFVVIAVCLGAYGVRGDVRIKSFTDVDADAFAYGPLFDETGTILVTPVRIRRAKDQFIVTPEEQREKEAWDALKGTLLHVPRTVLPDVAEDETYIEDLIGLKVIEASGEICGHVKAVHNFGAGDLIEIDLVAERRSVMVPFTKEDVPNLDLTAGKLCVTSLALWDAD